LISGQFPGLVWHLPLRTGSSGSDVGV
jgi:hypothetical protein